MKPEAELKKLAEIPSNNNAYCKRNSDLEDVEKRDLFSKNFNCHNRARKTVLFGSPIHYLNTTTNKYEDIDLFLKANEDSVVNDTNSFKTTFNKNPKSNSVFEISKDNYTISLKLVNQNGTKGEEKSYNKQVSDGSKFIVKENNDVEYNYKVLNNKVKDEIVINKKQDDYKYDFIIEVNNLEVQLADDGIINLVDIETGKIKFYIPRPFMVDNDGKQSKDIDCLVTKNSESSYLLSLIPNVGWLNDKERSFPVIIDPEIVEYNVTPFIVKTYQKSFIYSSSGTGYYWELIPEEIFYLNSNYRLEIILDTSSFDIPINKICSLIFNLGFYGSGTIYVNNRPFNYSRYDLDLSSLINNNFDFHFIIDIPEGTYLTGSNRSWPYMDINFEMEYILDSFGNTQTTLSLSPSINAFIDLADGDLAVSIPDTIIKTGNLNVPIYHNYGRYDTEQNCGKYFILNLHQKIKQVGDKYFYLNPNGEYEEISEKFYYIGNGWCRYYVQKSQLILTNEQELAVVANGITYNVYRELITDSGLSFSSRVEHVNCLKYIDQRIDSEKEIQDYLDSCITSLKLLKLYNCDTKVWTTRYISANYETDNFASFLSETSYNVLAVDDSIILQFRSLYQQIDSLNYQRTDQNEDLIDEQVEVLEDQIDLLKNTCREQKNQIEKLYSNYLAKRKEFQYLRRLIPQWILDGGSIKYGFNYLGNLCAIFNDNNDYLSIVWKTLNTQNGQVEAINEIVNDDVSVLFEYSYSGQLLTINNCGKIIRYNYSGNKLEGILLDNGEFVRLLYKTSGLLSSIATSKQMIYDFSYNNLEKVTQIKSSSFLNNINSSSICVLKETNYYSNLSKYQTSNISITYQDGKTTIYTNEHYSNYHYDENRHIYLSYEKNYGEYTNLKLCYFEKELCSVTIYPKKPSQKVDNISQLHYDLDSILTDMQIFASGLPNISSITGGAYPNYGEADYIISHLDCLNRVVNETISWQKVSTNRYLRTTTEYLYGARLYLTPCIKKTINHWETSDSTSDQDTSLVFREIEEYENDSNGRTTKKKHYVVGEELNNGVEITEYEYDENGNQIINRVYNSLDASTKSYEEKMISNNGLVVKSFDEIGENKTNYSYDSFNRLISKSSNHLVTGYGYDKLNRLVSVSQSTEIGEQNVVNKSYYLDNIISLSDKNNLVDYSYDKKNRVKIINHNGVTSTFSYSGSVYDDSSSVYGTDIIINGIQFYGYQADKVTTISNGISADSFYDKKGRLFEIKENNIERYHTNYSNDLLQIEFIRKGNESDTGFFISYSYDQLKRLSSVEMRDGNSIVLLETVSYNEDGKMDESVLRFDNSNPSYVYEYTYSTDSRKILKETSIFGGYSICPSIDVSNRYIGRTIKNSNDSIIQKERIVYRQAGDHASNMPSSVYYDSISNGISSSSLNIKYKYDSSNNISEVRENGILVSKYYYDYLNRLVREDNKKIGKTYLYSYDNNGNILFKREAPFTNKPVDEILSFNNEKQFLYDGDKLIKYDDELIVYDQYNRPTNYRGLTMAWDKDRLVQYGNNTFSYDGLGRRISKNNINYLYDSNGQLVRQTNGNTALIFAYDCSGVVGFRYNGEDYLYRKNILGDVISIVKISNNSIVASYIYDAWGNHKVLDSNDNIVNDYTHIGFINPFRYRSYYFDDETGLYYLKSRYYDPTICRFISMDSLHYLNPNVINGLNVWLYCFDNPMSYIDSSGKFSILLAILIGALTFAFSISGGIATQTLVSIGSYIGLAVASIWDKDIRDDMNRIHWNPFNTDEEAVLESTKVSFYKGVPVYRIDGKRSGSFAFIMLQRTGGHDFLINTLKHEYGHTYQQAFLGPGGYALWVVIPSYNEWEVDSTESNYYNKPWESLASFIGGDEMNKVSAADVTAGFFFLVVAKLFGPFAYFFAFWG